MVTFVKQYGLERTGTNAVRALLEGWFERVIVLMHVLGDKHSAPVDLEATLRATAGSRDPALAFVLAATDAAPALTTDFSADPLQPAFVRWVAPALYDEVRAGRLRTVVSLRDPYDWMRSMLRWEAAEGGADVDAVAGRLCSRYNDLCSRWLSLRPLVVPQEDLFADVGGVVRQLADSLGLRLRQDRGEPRLPHSFVPSDWDYEPAQEAVTETYARRRREGALAALPERAHEVVTRSIDWELVAPFGYAPREYVPPRRAGAGRARSAPTLGVSAVVCTRNRPQLLRAALESILAGRAVPAEIVVVDDGSDPPVTLPPPERVPLRLVRLGGEGAGAARAAGLGAAREELVAWCDDDDVWFEDHLAELVAYLDAHPHVALAYGDAEWWHHPAEYGNVAYSVDYDGALLRDSQNFILTSTAVCRTSAAREAGGFDPSLRACEDWDLWMRIGLHRAIRHLPRVLGAVRWTGDGIAAGDNWAEWEQVHAAHAARVRAVGAAAEHDLAVREPVPRPLDPETWCPERRELVWHSPVARQLISALERQGVDVRIAPTLSQPDPDLERLHKQDDGRGRIAFYGDPHCRPRALGAELTVSYGDWPVDLEAVDEINRGAVRQYVPSRFARDAYVSAGVEVPVSVLPYGVSMAPLERLRRDVLTFGMFSKDPEGVRVAFEAFFEEFSPEEPVRLLVRDSRPRDGAGEFVRETADNVREWQLALLREIDVYVQPSRSGEVELHGLEALASGALLIATGFGGSGEYLDDDSLSLRFIPAGDEVEPDREHLRELMRWCLGHRDGLPAMGARASERVRRDFSWDAAAATIRRDLDALAAQDERVLASAGCSAPGPSSAGRRSPARRAE